MAPRRWSGLRAIAMAGCRSRYGPARSPTLWRTCAGAPVPRDAIRRRLPSPYTARRRTPRRCGRTPAPECSAPSSGCRRPDARRCCRCSTATAPSRPSCARDECGADARRRASASLSGSVRVAGAASLVTAARFVDLQRPALELFAVELFDRLRRVRFVRHLDEPEAARLPGQAIFDDRDGVWRSDAREVFAQLVLCRSERQVPHVQLASHRMLPPVPLRRYHHRERWCNLIQGFIGSHLRDLCGASTMERKEESEKRKVETTIAAICVPLSAFRFALSAVRPRRLG